MMKLQKYMSQAGICSRRKAEEYILMGEVKVNSEIAHIGQVIDPEKDKIEFGNKILKQSEDLVYYKFNKPKGIVTTLAQNEERGILDIVDIKERVFPIGRLDKDSTGLILLTNDGRLANFLMHPKYEHEKEYIVETAGIVEERNLNAMRNGIFILGSMTKPADVTRINAGKFKIILKEGRNRQIRRMVEHFGGKVKRLKRIRIQNILLGDLEIGEYKKLSKEELNTLFKTIGIE